MDAQWLLPSASFRVVVPRSRIAAGTAAYFRLPTHPTLGDGTGLRVEGALSPLAPGFGPPVRADGRAPSPNPGEGKAQD